MVNIIEDVSTLTTIPVKTLNSLLDKVNYCIIDSIKESKLEGKEVAELDIGIGTLLIQISDNQLKCKFVPSSKLTRQISDLIKEGINPLEEKLETSLVDKVENIYKNLI